MDMSHDTAWRPKNRILENLNVKLTQPLYERITLELALQISQNKDVEIVPPFRAFFVDPVVTVNIQY